MADTMLQHFKVWVNLCVYTQTNSTLQSRPPYLKKAYETVLRRVKQGDELIRLLVQ